MMQVELLAPVGSWASLEAAVKNGANAVYLGGTLFSARQNATNFDREELERAVDYCHIRGVKVFVTVNTLIAEEEFNTLGEYILFLYNIDIDAVIIQDLGVAKFIKELLPDLEIHASTQMTAHNLEDVKMLEEIGFKRVVLSREMSKEEIKYINDHTDLDIEIFVHGALCVSYSGQCLMSSLIGGRSGNRGRCAQPCRKEYDLVDMKNEKKIKSSIGDYLLSPKDLNTLENINEILDTGNYSLKIEGRMKRPEYVAVVVRAYRDAIDQYEKNRKKPNIDKQTLKDVEQMFNRKFTKGYILGDSGKEFMSIESPSNRGIFIGQVISYDQRRKKVKIKLKDTLRKGDGIQIWARQGDHPGTIVPAIIKNGEKNECAYKDDIIEVDFKHQVGENNAVYKTSDIYLLKKAKETYEKNETKNLIYAKFKARLNEGLEVSLRDEQGNYVNQISEACAEKAINRPIDQDRIEEQISKLGNTSYTLKNIEIDIDEGISFSIKELNKLRRNVVESLDKLRQNYNKREWIDAETFKDTMKKYLYMPKKKEEEGLSLSVKVNNMEQLETVLNFKVDRIYYNDMSTIEQAIRIGNSKGMNIIPCFFRITEDKEIESIEEKVNKISVDQVMVGNLGMIHRMNKYENISIISDYSLNVFNPQTVNMLKDLQVSEITLSPELTLKQIKNIVTFHPDCEVIVHGRIPVMVSKYCPIHAVKKDDVKQSYCAICKDQSYGLKDQKGMTFPMVKHSNCKIEILNSQRLCVIENMRELVNVGVHKFRIDFTIEEEREIKNTLKAYTHEMKILSKETNKDDYRDEFIEYMKKQGRTKGHFFRGVE
ncbi:U32 family peptidase [Lutibacter sp. B2]|nr:U32 family peptidase [Lutibacter sp. B2]